MDCENSEVIKQKTGCAIGTVMEVKDLFFNLPVRLKFLKNPSTEFSYIVEISQLIALSNPGVSIVLKNNNSEYFKTSGSNDLKTAICEIYTNSFMDKLKTVVKTDLLSGLKISGYAATPDFTRSSRKSVITFLNGRVVKCQILSKAIETAYKSMLPIKRYPFVIVNLQMPVEDVDINVHPQKKEVRYKSPNQVFQFVMSAISSAISSSVSIDSSSLGEEKKIIDIFAHTKSSVDDDVVYVSEEQMQSNIYNLNEVTQKTVFEANTDDTFLKPSQVSSEKEYRIIGQYQNTYILIEYS